MMAVLLPYLSMERERMRKKKNQRVSSFHSFGVLFFPSSPFYRSFFLFLPLPYFFSNSMQDAWHQRLNVSTFPTDLFLFVFTHTYFLLYNARKGNVNTEREKNDEVISKLSSSLTSSFFFSFLPTKNQSNFYFFFLLIIQQ